MNEEQLKQCADWHDGAASRLEMSLGTTIAPYESATQSWIEQHRRWASEIRLAVSNRQTSANQSA